jgi:hypothetical protein
MTNADRLLNADRSAGKQHSAHEEPSRNSIALCRYVRQNHRLLMNSNAVAFSREVSVNTAAAPDLIGLTYPAEATETHRRGPERIAEQPQTRANYTHDVLTQTKAAAK